MSIYDIPGIVANAFPRAFTPENIQSGFKACGICPFDRDIFTEHDFSPSYVTDRPLVTQEAQIPTTSGRQELHQVTPHTSEEQKLNSDASIEACGEENSNTITGVSRGASTSQTKGLNPRTLPQEIRPLPKAGPRKNVRNHDKRRRTTAILTDSPVKENLEYIQAARQATKKGKKLLLGTKTTKKILKKEPAKADKCKDENYLCIVCLEPFSESRENDVWVQCIECKNWAHNSCTKRQKMYVCHNCDTD